jgi:hypothetical protein
MEKEKMEALDAKEQALAERLAKLEAMEKELRAKEKAMKQQEKAKKQIILRITPSLWEEIAQWADEDFRSINSQIEFLLTEAVKKRKNK